MAQVLKTKWQENPEVLEDALGRVCHHPLISEEREMINNPSFDKFFDKFKRRFEGENKEPEA